MNTYLSSISNNVPQIQLFIDDLEANFLNALQARFIVAPTQVTYINNMQDYEKFAIVEAGKGILAIASLSSIGTPVQIEVENAPQGLGNPKVKYEVYIEISQTDPKPKVGGKIKFEWTC